VNAGDASRALGRLCDGPADAVHGDEIDESGFTHFCHWEAAEGVSALVVNGTTARRRR
jgi:hypothetical protein